MQPISEEMSYTEKDDFARRIPKKLRVLFSQYADYDPRSGQDLLRPTRFHKLMLDAAVESSLSLKQKLDLIFTSMCRSNAGGMPFKSFLDALPAVAKLLYPLPDAEALQELLRRNLADLCDRPDARELSSYSPSPKQAEKADPRAAKILIRAEDAIGEIFRDCFPWPRTGGQPSAVVRNRIAKGLTKVLANFDICPSVLSKGAANRLIGGALGEEEPAPEETKSPSFTPKKFSQFLAKLAGEIYSKGAATAESLCYLFERMEGSPGFVAIRRRLKRPVGLLPPGPDLAKVLHSAL